MYIVNMVRFFLVVFFSVIISVCVVASERYGDFYAEVKTTQKVIAFSFDDGPGEFTEEILKVLRSHGIRATFFIMGSQIKLYPEALKKTAREGHELANHTYSHINFYSYKKPNYREVLKTEIKKTEMLIFDLTGRKTSLLRMPHGYIKPWVKEVAKETGYVVVNWSFGYDWHNKNIAETAELYKKNIKPGAILLFHDGGKKREKTVEVLKEVILEVKKRGYRILTVGEMLRLHESNS